MPGENIWKVTYILWSIQAVVWDFKSQFDRNFDQLYTAVSSLSYTQSLTA